MHYRTSRVQYILMLVFINKYYYIKYKIHTLYLLNDVHIIFMTWDMFMAGGHSEDLTAR